MRFAIVQEEVLLVFAIVDLSAGVNFALMQNSFSCRGRRKKKEKKKAYILWRFLAANILISLMVLTLNK